ncbi:MAG: hypothetical protein IJY71_07070 [Clostridia bacterium]|nr:hypothetical protein [Clostridia bacterium]
MLFALRKDPEAVLQGLFYELSTTESGTPFMYAPVEDVRRYRDASGRNLVIKEGVTAIRTAWPCKFTPGSYVILSDGNRYIIEQTARDVVSTAYQALATCAVPERDWILTVRLVSNARGVTV